TGMESKYIGNTAVVVKDVSKNSGRVAIYGEEWQARTTNDDVIPKGSNVKILSNESIVLYVEKI
ncbi:MAG: NfeD family protein, partial [Candidatus Gastranaerophilaceae bacterium]